MSKGIAHEGDAAMHRRNFLKASALAPAAVALAATPALAQSSSPLNELANQLDESLFSSDGLSVPIADKPTPSPLASGLDRTLVLGGGGTYYLAWYCGFFHGLFDEGIDAPSMAEMIVGTSAGAYAGSSMASGHFQRMRTAFDFFGHVPKLFAKLAPVGGPNTSQERAQKINAAAKDGSLATRQMIGHAALAADNHLNGEGVERMAAFLTGDSKTAWPAAKMHTTAMDCYSGERIVVSQATARKNDIALARGTGASSSRRPGGRLEARCDRHAQRWPQAAVPDRHPAPHRSESPADRGDGHEDALDQGRSAGRQPDESR